jgi:hypothetical protein
MGSILKFFHENKALESANLTFGSYIFGYLDSVKYFT